MNPIQFVIGLTRKIGRPVCVRRSGASRHMSASASVLPFKRKKVVVESSFLPSFLPRLLCSLVRDLKCTMEKEKDAAAATAAAAQVL